MAQTTDPRLQQQVIDSIYVRAHTQEGAFLSIIPDLDRIDGTRVTALQGAMRCDGSPIVFTLPR